MQRTAASTYFICLLEARTIFPGEWCGALNLGEGEPYSLGFVGVKGIWHGVGFLRACVELVVWLRIFFRPAGACPFAGFLPTAYAVGCALSPLRGCFLARLFCIAASRLFNEG